MEVIVDEENVRIDKYLASKTDYSRETITKMLAEEYILVNGKSIKASYKVKVGDVILIKDGFVKEMSLEATKMDIDIVYEDEYLMVINKDSGVVVHPGAGNSNDTLVNGLLYYNKTLSKGEEFRPGIVHRLDKDTSGLMIVAKDDKAHELLADDFKNKRIHREYIALLDGVFPQKKAIIDAPIGRSKQYFDKMEVCKDGKKAITNLEVIKKYKDYTLVKLVLETGRTHQIRVHLAYIGYPVHNDPVYSNKVCTDFGQFLHSAYLKFKHPITGEVLEFNSKLPEEFQTFIDNLL
ncbi:MAG: RluA family pseudouridine synthase [Firmicutes bacterium]|nr:RluA family pseudouridine synthase [Bacillota bacterium]